MPWNVGWHILQDVYNLHVLRILQLKAWTAEAACKKPQHTVCPFLMQTSFWEGTWTVHQWCHRSEVFHFNRGIFQPTHPGATTCSKCREPNRSTKASSSKPRFSPYFANKIFPKALFLWSDTLAPKNGGGCLFCLWFTDFWLVGLIRGFKKVPSKVPNSTFITLIKLPKDRPIFPKYSVLSLVPGNGCASTSTRQVQNYYIETCSQYQSPTKKGILSYSRLEIPQQSLQIPKFHMEAAELVTAFLRPGRKPGIHRLRFLSAYSYLPPSVLSRALQF